jgi:ribonuclease HI
MFTDGAKAGNGAAGYAVVWKSRQQWVGVKSHMAYNQEAFDAECAALARALEVAARRRTTPERVTIFTDAQAAIRRRGQTSQVQDRNTLSRAAGGSRGSLSYEPSHSYPHLHLECPPFSSTSVTGV